MAFEDSVYLPCGDEVSQGDIVDELTWGAIESPLTICRPTNVKQTKGRSSYNEAFRMSDAFERTRDGKEYIHAKAGRGPGVVLWHSCEIDDALRHNPPQKALVGIAPIFCMADRVPQNEFRNAIRSRQRSALFPLAPLEVGDFQLGEAYVDFRLIWSVKQSILKNRLATLNETVLHSLYDHLILFLTRQVKASPDS